MRRRRGAVAAVGALLLAVWTPELPARAATAPPTLFGVRLEGYAVRAEAFTTASSANPGSGYSFAKIDSNPGYDGGRDLEMKVVATNNDPGDLAGAVVFGATSPVNGSNLPGYADAYFPTFEGYSQISEKCVANPANREAPECRAQPGPYALAQVVPDESSPRVLGLAYSSGTPDHRQTVTRAEIGIGDDGAIVAVQDNRADDQQVPGTPIVVDFAATARVSATVDGVEATAACTARITVGGEPIDSGDELEQVLGPFSAATGIRVAYEPPTAPAVVETGDGGREVSCTGARFTISAPVQGQSGVTYTYGRTFAASSLPDNPTYGDGPAAPPPSAGSVPVRTSVPSVGSATGPLPTIAPSVVPSEPDGPTPVRAPVSYVAERIDTMPLAVGTAAATVLLPLGVWVLLGVTGSLARGLPRLRLPPFPR